MRRAFMQTGGGAHFTNAQFRLVKREAIQNFDRSIDDLDSIWMVEDFVMRAQNSILFRLSHNAGHHLVTVLAKHLLKIFLLVKSWHEEMSEESSVCFTAELLVSTLQPPCRSTYPAC
jgi:hypothetical protein